jgi:hypothetical protein
MTPEERAQSAAQLAALIPVAIRALKASRAPHTEAPADEPAPVAPAIGLPLEPEDVPDFRSSRPPGSQGSSSTSSPPSLPFRTLGEALAVAPPPLEFDSAQMRELARELRASGLVRFVWNEARRVGFELEDVWELAS